MNMWISWYFRNNWKQHPQTKISDSTVYFIVRKPSSFSITLTKSFFIFQDLGGGSTRECWTVVFPSLRWNRKGSISISLSAWLSVIHWLHSPQNQGEAGRWNSSGRRSASTQRETTLSWFSATPGELLIKQVKRLLVYIALIFLQIEYTAYYLVRK
jgi:hypothetical protein